MIGVPGRPPRAAGPGALRGLDLRAQPRDVGAQWLDVIDVAGAPHLGEQRLWVISLPRLRTSVRSRSNSIGVR